MTYEELKQKARAYWDSLTAEQQAKHNKQQSLCWSYGNLACTTNHKPQRAAFLTTALARGWTEAEFDEWAKGREWW